MHTTDNTIRRRLLEPGTSSEVQVIAASDDGPRDVDVAIEIDNISQAELPGAAPKPRPLSLKDDFEIVGGVPAFVWKRPDDYEDPYFVYAISSDGTRFAIKEKWNQLCVYDVLDNFSLIARWTNTSTEEGVCCLTFYENQNDILVAVYRDSTVALMSIEAESDDAVEQTWLSPKQIGTIEIVEEFQMFNKRDYNTHLDYYIDTYESETWVCAKENGINGELTICSITLEGFQQIQTKTAVSNYTIAHCSIPEQALMLVPSPWSHNNPPCSTIWYGMRFETNSNDDVEYEITGESFGFSDCGRYILVWKQESGKEDKLELFELQNLRKAIMSTSWKYIGRSIVQVKGQFLKRDENVVHALQLEDLNDFPIVSYLVVQSNAIKMTFWDPFSNKDLKVLDLTIEKLKIFRKIHIDVCFSPNMKWVAIGCWYDGTFSLFSLLSESLVWSANLSTCNAFGPCYVFLKFDVSSTKLMVNTGHNLYAFCPPCLIESFQMEFQSVFTELIQNTKRPTVSLPFFHRSLISEPILMYMLFLRYGLMKRVDNNIIDVAISRTTSNIALLVWINGFCITLQGLFEFFFTLEFQHYIDSEWRDSKLPEKLTLFSVNLFNDERVGSFENKQSAWIFLYPNDQKDKDLNVVFFMQHKLFGFFFEHNNIKNQELVDFSNIEPFAIKQTKDGDKVAALSTVEVIIIDLNKKEIHCRVLYRIRLDLWIKPYIARKKNLNLDIASDGKSIIVGFNKKNGELLAITSRMDKEECKNRLKEDNGNVHWCFVEENTNAIAFFDFNESNQDVSAICIYDTKNSRLRKIYKEQWNSEIARLMDMIVRDQFHEFALHFDENNGHSWITALHKTADKLCLTFIPISPYSSEGCIPSLSMFDYPTLDAPILEQLASKFGTLFFSMLFNGMNNFQLAYEKKNKSLMKKFINLANKYGPPPCELILRSFGKKDFEDVWKTFVKEKNELGFVFLLDLIEEKHVSFNDSSLIMKAGFDKLWLKCPSLLQRKMNDNTFAREICEFDIPSCILVKHLHVESRMGTINSIPNEWRGTIDKNSAFACWKALHKCHMQEIKPKENAATITVFVIFFTMADICKIGLNGILRFFLMEEAPTCIFKTPLVKWVIEYKWQNFWKKRSSQNFRFYLLLLAVFSAYSIWMALCYKKKTKGIFTHVCLTILVFLFMIMAFRLSYLEYNQLMSGINDGKVLFDHDRFWGFRRYFKSSWNIIEVLSYVILLLVIPPLHITKLFGCNVEYYICIFIALETFLIWIKVWYFAKILQTTQAFVLMIKSIIRDILPFLCLALVLLIGFSITLFGLFQHSLREKEDDDVLDAMNNSFGNPLKAMLTLFYAMVGAFEPEIFYDSGSLSWIIIMIFVLYLGLQMILVLNTIIAAMGDTYDRVKSTNEELLLMERARFIDDSEAQLTQKKIKEIDDSIGKYLYVLFPKDEDLTEEMKLWQGRVKTIEESVRRMIKESQNKVIDEMKEEMNEIRQMKDNIDEIKDIKKDVIELKQIKEDINGIKQISQSTEQIREEIEHVKLTMATILGKVERDD